jgi:hypothetical protein
VSVNGRLSKLVYPFHHMSVRFATCSFMVYPKARF